MDSHYDTLGLAQSASFDEVKTGFTVAWGGAVDAFDVVPDLVCLAKALGGGLPCGAIGGTRRRSLLLGRRRLRQRRWFIDRHRPVNG